MEKKKRVLMGCPVRVKPNILQAFLDSLTRLNRDEITLDFFFIDDNNLEESRLLLYNFTLENSKVIIERGDRLVNTAYHTDEITHNWNIPLMVNVAFMRNMAIDYALKFGYDYILNIDSDEIIHPNLINSLISLDKPVISEIVWTKWTPDGELLPNAWKCDQYRMDSANETARQFLDKLKVKGIYEVGGFGGFSLLKRETLEKGLCFSPLSNISIIGEDRWLCIRALVLGYELLIDTNFPFFHIYREKDLESLEEYVRIMYNV
jgi:hypothetical protein